MQSWETVLRKLVGYFSPGSTFGSCTTELNDEPHQYKWDSHSSARQTFRLWRPKKEFRDDHDGWSPDRCTRVTVKYRQLEGLYNAICSSGEADAGVISGIAAEVAGAMDLFMRAYPDWFDFDHRNGRCHLVYVGAVLPEFPDVSPNPIASEPVNKVSIPSTTTSDSNPSVQMEANGSVREWLQKAFCPAPDDAIPLFEPSNDDPLVAQLFCFRQRQKTFRRCARMESRVRELASQVVGNPSYDGVLYLMFHLGDESRVDPLYIGIAGWRNRKGDGVSANFKGVADGGNNSQFMRWGYGNYWHIGQLSDAAFYSAKSHSNWVPRLFEAAPRLHQTVYWQGIPWPSDGVNWEGIPRSLHQIERDLIESFRAGGILNIA